MIKVSVIIILIGLLLSCSSQSIGLQLIYNVTPYFTEDVFYEGTGTLHAFLDKNDVNVYGAVYHPPFYSPLLKKYRALMIYLPPGYDENKEYPVLFGLHGYSERPQLWVKEFLIPMDKAITEGAAAPMVVVLPDFTISGNGQDNPSTYYDERLGAWYIDSNKGKFRSHFMKELLPFVESFASVYDDPHKWFLMGFSMGGFGAVTMALEFPGSFKNVIALAPDMDLRYSIKGNRLAPFDSNKYEPVKHDDRARLVNTVGLGIVGATDEWLYYPVFDSDTLNGDVWFRDIPLWERLQEYNPADILRNKPMHLWDNHFYIIAGDKDEFNFDDHLKVVLPLLTAKKAKVYPENHIIHGGTHSWLTWKQELSSIYQWINTRIDDSQTWKVAESSGQN